MAAGQVHGCSAGLSLVGRSLAAPQVYRCRVGLWLPGRYIAAPQVSGCCAAPWTASMVTKGKPLRGLQKMIDLM